MIDSVEVRLCVLGGNHGMVSHSQDVRFKASSIERFSRVRALKHPTDIPPDADVMLDQVHSGPDPKLTSVNATPRQSGSEKSEYLGKYPLIELLSN